MHIINRISEVSAGYAMISIMYKDVFWSIALANVCEVRS